MSGVRLILALHNHQPVGNFDGVFEAAYRDSYLPFLDVLEDYPQIPFALHTSGPLMEWLVEHRPEYVARVRALLPCGDVVLVGHGHFSRVLIARWLDLPANQGVHFGLDAAGTAVLDYERGEPRVGRLNIPPLDL